MRGVAWVLLVALVAGCALPQPGSPTPTPPADDEPAPLSQNPEALPPRSRPVSPAPTIPGPGPAPATPTPSSDPPPPASTPSPPAADPAQEPAPDVGDGGGAPPWIPPPQHEDDGTPERLVRFEPGLDGPDGTFILSWTRASDGLGFRAQLAAVADAQVRIDSLARVASTAERATPIVLSAYEIDDAFVTSARLALWDGEDLVGELDLLTPSPSFEALLPAGATWDLSWTLALAEGAQDDLPVVVRLGVAS